jgi:rhodanese-related sulfurtransferase
MIVFSRTQTFKIAVLKLVKFRYLLTLIICHPSIFLLQAQSSKTKNATFADKINETLSFTVPMISAKEVLNLKDAIILDAREQKEYKVSHLPNAQCVGYDKMDENLIASLDKNKTIILYCSIGYRSEKVGEKLQKKGFKKVYNLYGSIFEWANLGYPLVTSDGKATNKIHVYDKLWGRWMENNAFIKVY